MSQKNSSQRKQPFEATINHSMKLRNIDFHEAMDIVQKQYQGAMDRNQKLVERQDDSANNLQIHLNSHFAVLATLTLTVTGFLISQSTANLTDAHKWIILFILFFESLSLLFCALDYRHSIKFHNKWAKAYHAVDNEVNDKINSGEIQKIEDIRSIEQSNIHELPKESLKIFSTLMIAFCISGLAFLIILFYSYFFDVPFWSV